MLHLGRYNKNFTEMTEEAINSLKENTPINNFSNGSIARALVEVYNDEMDQFYDRLQISMAMKFVSMASGAYLDEIARIFDIERYEDESDDNFRYRIVHATESLAKANETAVRLAVLSVNGVYDVETQRFTRGTGTFDMYLAIEDPANNDEVIDKAQQEIEEIQAFGISGNILEPDIIPVDMEVVLTFTDDVHEDEIASLKDMAEKNIVEYINNVYFDDSLIIVQLIDEVMNISSKIKNMQIISLNIDDDNVPVRDQRIGWNEQAVAHDIIVN